MAVVDLHTHTTASDGTNAPSVNVRLAKDAGLAGLAVTDHDTVAGVAEAVAEGSRLGIAVVPGVEISTVHGGQDIHVLGYYVRHEDAKLLERLRELRETRTVRNEMMLAKLRELGLDVDMEDVMAVARERNAEKRLTGRSVGRPHIAEALVNKGHAASVAEAFERYLGKTGAAYVNPPRIDPFTAVEWIHEAGGTAVVAHPGLYDDDGLVRAMIRAGVDGIEAYHSDHSPEQEAHYARMAEDGGLLVTAGSDYHGERNGVVFHAPIGSRNIDIAILDRLRAARGGTV